MDKKYVYHISWASFGFKGLNAVVVARNDEEGVKLLNLKDDPKCVKATCIGEAKQNIPLGILAEEFA